MSMLPAYLDNYTSAARLIRLFHGDIELSHATCFFWKTEEQLYLITNWHVVTGRNTQNLKALNQDHPDAPDTLECLFRRIDDTVLCYRVPLYDEDGRPAWLIHPAHQRLVDVVAIPVPSPSDDVLRLRPVNLQHESQLATKVGMPVFILGFPFRQDAKPEVYPIWKQGTIASEPDFALRGATPLLVDTASRPGMSGAPVIQRSYGYALVETSPADPTAAHSPMNMDLRRVPHASKFIGVYSGRLHTNSQMDAQLGVVWRKHLIEEILAGYCRDIHPNEQEPLGLR